MISRKQIEIRHHSMLSKRLYYLRKLRENMGTHRYDDYVVKLNDVEHVLGLFEWMLKERRV